MKKGIKLVWKVNTSSFLKEIGNSNPNMAGMGMPLTIFMHILAEVGNRAAELNDDKLNALMCRLSIYSVSDQYNEDYDEKIVKETLEKVGWA